MPQKKILIVDDEKLVRWALAKKCAEYGYQSVEAGDGEEALRVLQNESPDAVLLDVHLPGQSGIEVLEKLKQGGDTRTIIMMTADPQLDDVKAALRLEAYDFVSKPINYEELGVTLQNALEAGALRTEVESLRGEVRMRSCGKPPSRGSPTSWSRASCGAFRMKYYSKRGTYGRFSRN